MNEPNTNRQLNNGNLGVLAIKNALGKHTLRLLGGLLLIGMLAMATTFGPVSADNGPVYQFAGDYTVSPPVLSGPPTTENGVTSIAGTVAVETRGTQVGSVVVEFTCDLGTGPGGANECEGTYFFEGSLRGKSGTFRATMTNWTAGGEAAFTSVDFKLISGSGTGGLSNLVKAEGKLLRDEAAGPVGVYFGEAQFEIIVVPPSTLTEFSLQDLFSMESDGAITTEGSVAELTLRASSD
ncbi:MAG: hypothetical protein IID01_13290 [Chloroflexi bacterium]|nr:hypothetical protein [Chloroflexota bacterium]